MPANVDAMLRAAIEAYKNGNKADARALLDKVLEVDEYNENAWMWMSAAVETAEEKRTCLENVLVINPNNEKARMGMKSLGFDPEVGAAPASNASVFTDTSFAGGAAQGASVWDDDEPPTATSSASSAGRPSNTNSGDLDSWISGMGIGSTTPKQPSLAPTPHPFTDLIRGDDEEEEEEEFDPFADRMNNMFSADEFDIDEPPARSAARPSSPAPSSSRAIPPASFSSPSLFDEDEDDSSPFDDDMSGLTDEDFDEFAALIEDEDAFAPPPRQSPMSPSGRSTSSQRAVTPVMDRDEDEIEGPDAAQLFAQIPKEIEAAARLPGEDEESPRALLIGILVLVVLNLAALGYILVG